MPTRKKRISAGVAKLVIAGVLALSACAPVAATRGNFVEEHQLAQIKPGEQSKSEVMRILGSPTTVAPFNENIWYYLGQHTEKHGIFDPDVVDERVIIVSFNNEDILESVREREGGRVEVPISDRKTPTHGNEVSAIQQILGNLGKFNPQEGP